MITPSRAGIVLLIASLAAGLAWLKAQQTAASDPAYASQPGGTPEEDLWQVLILFGAGDRDPFAWNGHLTAAGGDVHSIEGYRFELPDRVLPQGGWEAHTQMTRILKSSPVEGSGAGSETRVIPKGLLVRGTGKAARLSVTAGPGSFTVSPASLAFGEIQKELQGRVEIRRIPPATDLSGTTLRQHTIPPSRRTRTRCGPPGRAITIARRSSTSAATRMGDGPA